MSSPFKFLKENKTADETKIYLNVENNIIDKVFPSDNYIIVQFRDVDFSLIKNVKVYEKDKLQIPSYQVNDIVRMTNTKYREFMGWKDVHGCKLNLRFLTSNIIYTPYIFEWEMMNSLYSIAYGSSENVYININTPDNSRVYVSGKTNDLKYDISAEYTPNGFTYNNRICVRINNIPYGSYAYPINFNLYKDENCTELIRNHNVTLNVYRSEPTVGGGGD